MYCLYGISLLYTLLQRAVSTSETVLYIDKGVGNPSALTAEKWEIFFTTKKDSFFAGFASMLSLCTKRTGTGMCEYELNGVCVLFNATLRPWDVNLDSDALTGEDSLLDCSLLSNPAADLLDEFAPVAFTAQPHKGKLSLLSLMPNQSQKSVFWHEVKLIPVYTSRCYAPCGVPPPGHCFVFFPS